MNPLQIVLLSTYELGRQPFGLASPVAWLKEAGMAVTSQDLALDALETGPIQEANLIAFYLPMHTATRIATALLPRIRALNPSAHLCCYGLYAPLNAAYLRNLGVQSIIGGEFEEELVALARALDEQRRRHMTEVNGAGSVDLPLISLRRQQFVTPIRHGLPALQRYAKVDMGNGTHRTVGYTEATRGCKHTCRHCPIVPVYQGNFRVVQREVVLADIRNQVAAGAEHITFGDPDFFNGPGHAIPIVEALHAEFPDLTYDVTIKVEHLLEQAALLPKLKATGCLFVTSAVEAVDDRILAKLAKGHSRADFIKAASLLHSLDLQFNPTFVAFTPWITAEGYVAFLRTIAELDLIDHVTPIQYAIRLLITAESALLELPEIQALVHPFDEAALVYPWHHPEPAVDALQAQIIGLVETTERRGQSRREIFQQIWELSCEKVPTVPSLAKTREMVGVIAKEKERMLPKLSEPWYC